MHKILTFSILLVFFSLATCIVVAQDPPPPPAQHGDGGNTPPGGGAPVGSGTVVLSLIALGYGTKKWFGKSRK